MITRIFKHNEFLQTLCVIHECPPPISQSRNKYINNARTRHPLVKWDCLERTLIQSIFLLTLVKYSLMVVTQVLL